MGRRRSPGLRGGMGRLCAVLAGGELAGVLLWEKRTGRCWVLARELAGIEHCEGEVRTLPERARIERPRRKHCDGWRNAVLSSSLN